MFSTKYGLIFNEASQYAVPHPDRSIRSPMFVEITQAAEPWIVSQLVGKDGVHEFGARSEEELRRFRLGGPHTNKTCYAMIGDDDKLHAVIYVKRDTHDVSAGYGALNGNVGKILQAPVEHLSETPRSLIFYSITKITNMGGVAQLLVRNLHAHLTAEYPGVVLSTLSPMRLFDNFLQDSRVSPQEFASLSQPVQRRVIMAYLMKLTDPVQKFHMDNGAIIGDIKLRADTVGQACAMVNYVYPVEREALSENAKAFKARSMAGLVAPAIVKELKDYPVLRAAVHLPPAMQIL